MLISTTCSFPDILLPSNKNIDLSRTGEANKLFNTIAGIYGFAIEALETLKKGELIKFDSLATDCSCHLRALRLTAIAQEILKPKSNLIDKLELTLSGLKDRQLVLRKVGTDLTNWYQKGKKMSDHLTPIVSAIQKLQMNHPQNSYQFTVQDLLSNLNVKMELDLELAYAVHAYILTLVKDYKAVKEEDNVVCADKECGETLKLNHQVYKETTLPKNLSNYMKKLENHSDINGNLIEKEVYRLAKKQLTNLSAQFLLQETYKLDNKILYSILSTTQKLVEDKVELPDFYSLTGTFQVCLQRHIPVLLKIKKCFHAHRYQEPETPFDIFIYLFPKDGKQFVITPFSQLERNGPVIVVEGKRSGKTVYKESTDQYIQRLLKDFDFMHFCELDGAQHKQYTSDENSLLQKPSEVIPALKEIKYFLESKRIDDLKQEAEEKGCAFYNQSLLILSHIFADTLNKQYQEFNLNLKMQEKENKKKNTDFQGEDSKEL